MKLSDVDDLRSFNVEGGRIELEASPSKYLRERVLLSDRVLTGDRFQEKLIAVFRNLGTATSICDFCAI
jgi:hypothetical protein